jgi:hypothetical protein
MKVQRIASGLLLVQFLALIAGCAAEPFQRPFLPILTDPDPRLIREELANRLADRFVSDDTVIIRAPFRDDLAVLGVLRVDRAAGTFELLGMNHLGVKFFHLGGSRQETSIRFAMPPLTEQTEVLLSVAEDTRHMYFGLTPGDDAVAEIHPTFVRFYENTPEGKLVYEFGGQPVVLLEKRLEGFFGTIWRIRYYEYGTASSALYPRGIVMENSRFNYRIIVKNREWQVK